MPRGVPSDEQTPADKRRAAFNAAEKRLREENQQRFWELVAEEAQARGVEYKRRLTPQEKDEKAVSEILAKNPDLAAKYGQAPPA